MAVDVMLPDHRAPGAVWLRDDGAVRHRNPLAVRADAIMPAIGFPIWIGDYVPVRNRAALAGYCVLNAKKTAPAMPGAAFSVSIVLRLADGAAEIGAAIRHRQHDHLGADADPRIEIADVFVGEAEAAGGNAGADRL